MTEFFDLQTIILISIILLFILFLIIIIIRNPNRNSKKLQEYKAKIENCNKLLKDFEKAKNDKKLLIERNNAIQKQLSEKDAIHQKQINYINKESEEKIKKKEQQFADKLKEIEEQNKANAIILDKVRKVDILKDYARKVVDYVALCENILESANKKIDKVDVETAKIMSILLQQAAGKASEIANWKQICEDIVSIGVTVLNNDIKNCFQSNNETEQLNAFKKQSISRLRIITNNILILCEAYSNLSKFVDDTDAANIEDDFRNKFVEIKNSAKEVGIIEIAEVSIFTCIDSNSNVESENGHPSLPYSIVKNLKQDDIVEIISFGMKTEFDNMTKTKVLIY